MATPILVVIDLHKRIVTLSFETMKIVKSLPKLGL